MNEVCFYPDRGKVGIFGEGIGQAFASAGGPQATSGAISPVCPFSRR